MKSFPRILLFLILAAFLVAGSASAITLDFYTENPADSVYADTGAEYVFLTDRTPPASAPMIQLSASILSDYGQDYVIGIFDRIDGHSTDLAVLDTYQGVSFSNVLFDLVMGSVTSSIDSETMGTEFGFYIQFYSDIGGGDLTSEIYYSDNLNDPFCTFYDPLGIASLNFAEFGLGVGGPATLGHALVSVHDVAPVPEPATMLLLGVGLIGMAGVGRKRFLKKA